MSKTIESQELAEAILGNPEGLGRALFQCNQGRKLFLQILRDQHKVKTEGENNENRTDNKRSDVVGNS